MTTGPSDAPVSGHIFRPVLLQNVDLPELHLLVGLADRPPI
jgi:hypothetical protein